LAKRKHGYFLTTIPRACLYELGAASEIPAEKYCNEGICTHLGTTPQGKYAKICLRSSPQSRFSLVLPQLRLGTKRNA